VRLAGADGIGRTGVLVARSVGGGAVLEETEMDLGVDHALDLHLYFNPCRELQILKMTAFKPRLLLLIPSLTLTLLLLHAHERTNPLPSLLGVSTASASAGRTRVGPSTNSDTGKDTFSTSTGPDGQEIPVVPPKEVESGVDYYMNLQAIQNLMGLVYAHTIYSRMST